MFVRQIKLLTEALRHLEAKTVSVTGRAVVLRLGVFTVAVAAIHAFRHVVDGDVRIGLTISGDGFALQNVSMASQALVGFNGLEAILVAHRAIELMLSRGRHRDIGSERTGGKKSRHGNHNEFFHG